MRTVVLVLAGVLLSLATQFSIDVYRRIAHPLGPIVNTNCDLIEVTSLLPTSEIDARFTLRRGESRLLPYGEYKVSVNNGKGSFGLFKNNRGICKVSWQAGSNPGQGYLRISINESSVVSSLSETGSVSTL